MIMKVLQVQMKKLQKKIKGFLYYQIYIIKFFKFFLIIIISSRDEEYESEEEEETAQEKRIRLAKQYLAQIEEEGKI